MFNLTFMAGDTVLVSFEGVLDIHHSPGMRKVLQDCLKNTQCLNVDLSKVIHADSSMVAILVEALCQARKKGARLNLISVPARIKRIFAMARLETVFPIYENTEASVGSA